MQGVHTGRIFTRMVDVYFYVAKISEKFLINPAMRLEDPTIYTEPSVTLTASMRSPDPTVGIIRWLHTREKPFKFN
jgi:hypothetical protein